MFADVRFLVPAGVFLVVLVISRWTWNDAADGAPSWRLPVGIAAASGCLALAALWVAEHFLAVHFLAGGPRENEAAESSWGASLAYFVAMALGMVAQAVWHALERRTAKSPPVLDKWEFVKPALVAPIVFISVYNNIAQSQITIVMLLFSFQNGFFWQTVLRKQRT